MNKKTRIANELIEKMTIREKIGQIAQTIDGYRCYTITEDGDIEFTDNFKEMVAYYGGIGAISGLLRADPWSGHHYGNGITKEMRVCAAKKLQNYITENTRLKIPALIEIEASHGMQSLGSVMYPTGLCCAASFNPALYEEMMKNIGDEIAFSGNHVAFVTMIDLAQDPRWGRSEECLGEDPYLASKMASAAVKGIKKSGTLACAKHFVGAGACEGGINAGNIHIGKNELYESSIAPAKAAVEAGCDFIMVAYNQIDGQPCHSNRKLLTEYLRGELGYQGVLISDGGGVLNVADNLGISKKEAAVLCLRAGIDLSLCDIHTFTELESALSEGIICEEEIDNACRRVLEKKVDAGLFENKILSEKGLIDLCSDGHFEKCAYDMAAESVTLLKNDNILPLSGKECIAVIGENADDIYHLLGDYTSERLPQEGTTLLGGLHKNFENISYAKGWSFNNDNAFEQAINLAKESDIIIMCLGGTSRRDFEAKYLENGAVEESVNFMDCGEGRQLSSLSLPKQQIELLLQLKKLGKPIVSVVIMGRAYVLTEVAKQSDALLIGWYPGQEGGYAIADILAGKINPSGKLPVTLPYSSGVLPVAYNRYTGIDRYCDCNNSVLYPFGFGLSYSAFEYKNLSVKFGGKKVDVQFDITNVSDISGKEVAQMYLHLLGDSIKHPLKKLYAFKKVCVPKSETVSVAFSFAVDDIGFAEPISPSVEIYIGHSGGNYLYDKIDLK